MIVGGKQSKDARKWWHGDGGKLLTIHNKKVGVKWHHSLFMGCTLKVEIKCAVTLIKLGRLIMRHSG